MVINKLASQMMAGARLRWPCAVVILAVAAVFDFAEWIIWAFVKW